MILRIVLFVFSSQVFTLYSQNTSDDLKSNLNFLHSSSGIFFPSFQSDIGHNHSKETFAKLTPFLILHASEKTSLMLGCSYLFESGHNPKCDAFQTSIKQRVFQKNQKSYFLKSGFLRNTPGNIIVDHNYFIIAQRYSLQWRQYFGIAMRSTFIHKNERISSGISKEDAKLKDNRNSMYYLGYFLRPANWEWNAGIAISNFDDYLIEIESLPMLHISGEVYTNKSLRFFGNISLRQAGQFNLAASYYEFFVRGGVTWFVF